MVTTILVVEDEIIIGMDIRDSLIQLGYDVPNVITSGEKAIEKAEQIKPDLILMDIILKGKLDGVEAAKQIRDRLNLPVIFLTAHTDITTLERAKKTQPFGYIVKPFQDKDLQTTIEIALARCKAETEIRKALEKERELNELKSRFVSMVSHEFRTPLATVLFSAGLLESYGNRWPEEKKLVHLRRIQSAIQQMTSLLNDILLIGKADYGKLEFNPTPIDLEQFCRELVEDVELADRNQHQVILTIKASYNQAKMDEKLLRHILSNLLSNAIKYSPEDTKIEFNVICQDKKVTFQVKDTGIGIPLADQKRLFESFYRATNVGTISGTGLGLSIVKKSVELHGGTISVQSEEGFGTTFTVSLPLEGNQS